MSERRTSRTSTPHTTGIGPRLQAILNTHQQGQLEQAKLGYQQLLVEAPECADAHHLLGLCLLDLGLHNDALSALSRAAQLADHISEFHADVAAAEAACGNWTSSRRALQTARERGLRIAERLHAVGLNHLRKSQFEQAAHCFEIECELLPHAAAHHDLAVALLHLGRTDAAEHSLRAALALNPACDSAWSNLGLVLQKSGDQAHAIQCFERAIALQPNASHGHFNLGSAHANSKRWEQALASLSTACDLQPGNAEYQRRLATCYAELQRWHEAESAIERAAQIEPDNAEIRVQFGDIVQHSGDLERAMPQFEVAVRINPDLPVAWAKLGLASKRLGDADRARTAFSTLMRLEGSDESRYLRALSLPVIYRDENDIRQRRAQLESEIDGLLADGVRLDATKTVLNTTFLIAYQGFNDRTIQEKIAQLWQHKGNFDECDRPTKRKKRLRIGFLSSLLKYHTVGKLTRGWIKELNRDSFETVVLSPYEHRDQGAQWIRGAADQFVSLSRDLATAATHIASQQLDVLIYPEIGMDPLTMSLARLRLAPVQCAMWGHPVTSGLKCIDYFLSSELVEPDDADEHYTEQLIRFSTLPVFYYRPRTANREQQRHDFGLPANGNIYLCPHTLFKMHPHFDPLLSAILEQDPQGLLVLLEGRFQRWNTELRARFENSMRSVHDRVRFLPTLSHPEYLRLLEVSDVLLDSPHFGGGNTHYEAFSVGLPVVTRPSAFMRGRVAFGLYQKMQYDECIADSERHYVELALRLANDKYYARRVRQQIVDRSEMIYEDQQSTCELQNFLHDAGGSKAAVSRSLTSRRSRSSDSRGSEPLQQASKQLSQQLRSCTCPACGHHVAVTFFNPGNLPLATLAWPADEAEARTMKRLPHDFVRCVDCGHVYNAAFEYAEVPYSTKPNLMFNRGALWQEHLEQVRKLVLRDLPEGATVIEIGCGEGHLLRALAAARPDGRYIGFDPNASVETAGLFQARAELFDPAIHLAECQPDLLISRHVLEHLMNPNGFIQALAFAVSCTGRATRLLIEVPCIDHVIGLGRTVDFFYEHHSHFTTTSLDRMLRRSAASVEVVATSYNREVVYALAQFCPREHEVRFARESIRFAQRAHDNNFQVQKQLADLHASGRRVAVWGGTGKAAAFIQQHAIDGRRFPLVVDSDNEKVGTHVPGTGQRIEFRDHLLRHPVAVILIATQWRAADIVLEILRCGIPFETILLEHDGRLVDYFLEEHPYHAPQNRGGFFAPAVASPHIINIGTYA